MTGFTLPPPGEALARALWEGGEIFARLVASGPPEGWERDLGVGAIEATLTQLADAGLDVGAAACRASVARADDAALAALAARTGPGTPGGADALGRLARLGETDAVAALSHARVLRLIAGPGASLAALEPLLGARSPGRGPLVLAIECRLEAADPGGARALIARLAGDGGASPARAAELAFDAALAEAGIAALRAEQAAQAPATRAHPHALRRLIRHLRALGARDEAQALRAHLPDPGRAGAAEVRLLDAQEALAADDPDRAAALIAPDCPAEAPWRWGAALQALWLRIAAQRDVDPESVALHARGAGRVHGAHAGVMRQALICRMQVEDWSAIEAEPLPPAVPAAAARSEIDARLGRPDRALARLAALRDCLPQDARVGRARLAAAGASAAAQAGAIAAGLDLAGQPAQGLPAPVRIDLGLRMADLWLLAGRIGPARRSLEPLRSLAPDHPGLRARDGRIALVTGDAAAATAALAPLADTAEPTRTRAWMLRALEAEAAGAPGPHPARIARGLWRRQRKLAPAVSKGHHIVPRIHLYWEGSVPEPVTRAVSAWRALMPMAEVTLHDRAGAEARVGRDLGPETAAAFARLARPAQRADLLRLCLLAEAGGVWADADDLPRAGIADWLGDADAVFVIEPWFGTIANNFIATRPGHEAMLEARARVAAAIRTDPDPYAWWHTGPVPLTLAVGRTLRTEAGRGTRLLPYTDYLARIAPTLPLPHKVSDRHWRTSPARLATAVDDGARAGPPGAANP